MVSISLLAVGDRRAPAGEGIVQRKKGVSRVAMHETGIMVISHLRDNREAKKGFVAA